MSNSNTQPAKILNYNKQYRLLVRVAKLLVTLKVKLESKGIKSLIEDANNIIEMSAESRCIYLKNDDLTSNHIADDLISAQEDMFLLGALLATIKVNEKVGMPAALKQEIENTRAFLCEQRYEFSKKMAALVEKIKNILATIRNKIEKNPEEYNKHVQIIVENKIIKSINLIDRPAWSSNTKATFFAVRKEAEDIRHWKSSDLIKQEIRKMFENQPFDAVAAWLVEKEYADQINNVDQLQNALFKYWSDKYNEKSNLRLGASAPNRALGGLIPRLKELLANGKDNFRPAWFTAKSCGINNPENPEHPHDVFIDSWETLIDYFFNANFDFTFDERTMAEQLEIAACEFKFSYNF